jgi:hypothetical protein
LKIETDHFFSSRQDKDHFTLEFLPSDSQSSKDEYTHFDILSGNLLLSIYDPQHRKIYSHKWPVSNCYSMADNHYLNEEQKIEKFMSVFYHFFDSSQFNSMNEIKITGILKSADKLIQQEIESDPNSIGFSFIQEDFCVMYSAKSERAVLLRALKKDLLKKYNLL